MDGRWVFVSSLLKQRLEISRFKYLRFTEGLSEFAGQQTQQSLARDARNARA